jgi:uncharacterized protein YuzB (UPF0349 family)
MKSLRFPDSLAALLVLVLATQMAAVVQKPAVSFAGQPPFNGQANVMADLNGDGKLDLVYLSCSSPCSEITQPPSTYVAQVMLGNGDGTFQTAAPYSTGTYRGTDVAIADVNGDGIPDLVVTSDCLTITGNIHNGFPCVGDGMISVLLGNGNGIRRLRAAGWFAFRT